MDKYYVIMSVDRKWFYVGHLGINFTKWSNVKPLLKFLSHGEAIPFLEEATKEQMCEIVELYEKG